MGKKILILGHSEATQFIDIYNQYSRLFDLAQDEITVACLTGRLTTPIKERLLTQKVNFFDFSKNKIRGLKITPIIKLLQLCRKEQFDIVICHRYKPTYIMMWVAQFCKIKALIFVMHELRTMKAVTRRFLIAMLYRKNMIFAGVSNAVRDDLQQSLTFIPKKNIVTLYNMIDIDLTQTQFYTREHARKMLHLAEEDFIFGHIARLVPNKDQSNLILAFSYIKQSCPRAKLIIMGDGLLENELKSKIKTLGLETEVILTGFVPGAFRYMKAFDCFVLPSIQEAFGRVLLEAMIAKIPLIATKTHGIPEVVGDAGEIVPPKSPNELAESMKSIYTSTPEYLIMRGEQGYLRAKNYFSIPQFQKQFWQLPLLQSINHDSQ